MSLAQSLHQTIQEQQLVKRGETIVVGVSGGPDSLALLHALRALAPEHELRLHVAHLNHQLRGEDSDADEQFVLWLAREWGVPAASARWDVGGYARETRLSIEEAARKLRYHFLVGAARQVQAHAVAVAHNADDQVETILLHFLRGSGLSGLRGMAYQSLLQTDEYTTRLIRPLLDVTRDEVEEYCAEHGLDPRTDETNFDTTILRNRLRHNVIPYLETVNPNFRTVLRHSALSIADDYAYIHQNVLGIFERMARPLDDPARPSGYVVDRKWFRALPSNLQRGVLREAVSRLRRLKNMGYSHIENARRVAADKDAGTEASLPQGLVLVVGYDDFTIGEHLPLPDVPLLLHGEELHLLLGDELLLPESDWGVRLTGDDGQLATSRWCVVLDADRLQGELVLRTRRRGERFAPRGMGGKRKSLHEFMIDEKIPRHLREFTPLLTDEEKIVWVCGYRADERAAARSATTNRLRVEFFRQDE